MENYTFDLQRIFIGSTSPLFIVEIVLRTAVLFIYFLIALRFIGHRGLGQVTLFEFAIIIALGSASGDPMFYPNVPVLHGMVVITLIVLFQRLLVRFSRGHHRVERFVQGTTDRLIVDGCIDLDGVTHSLLSRAEVFMELRQKGIEHLGQVYRAYLEIDGQVSVFHYDNRDIRPGLPLLPPEAIQDRDQYGAGKEAPQSGKYACYHCGDVESFESGQPFSHCPRCHHDSWVKASTAKVPESEGE